MCLRSEKPDWRTDLPLVETVLLWSMRAWAIGMRSRVPVEERIDDVLARIGAAAATGQIYGFMWVVGYGAVRTIAVDCVCNTQVSDDERRLLAVLALAQRGRTREALALLRSLLTADAAGAALDSAVRVAHSFTAARRFLAPGWTPTGILEDPWTSNAHPHRIAMTIH